jgi:hypothetical protein
MLWNREGREAPCPSIDVPSGPRRDPGASDYIATMALFGVAPAVMRSTALVLNILDASLTTFRYVKADLFRWRTLWPVIAAGVHYRPSGRSSNVRCHPRKSGFAIEDARAHVDRNVPVSPALLLDRAFGASDFALTLPTGEMRPFGRRVADDPLHAPFAKLVDWVVYVAFWLLRRGCRCHKGDED